jgi:aryl-alcohol dehydrogenase-like predicted oxidoreductase
MTMRNRLLGRSGIRVSELCLGTMMFGADWNWRANADEEDSRKIFEAYREAGGNFVDTANIYADGRSEEILGRLIAPERDAVVVATKFTLEAAPGEPHPNSSGSHRKMLRQSIEGSLRRLGTDYVDVLWVHAWDQRTPIDETVRALDDLVASGKVLAVGISNTPAWVVSRAVTLAELRGWASFVGIQVAHSLVSRTAERDLLPMAKELGLLVTGWAPLAQGLLAGKETPFSTEAQRGVAAVAAEVARELGHTPAQVALAWSMAKGVVPVIGSTKVEQVRDSLGAAGLTLPDEQLARLDEASAFDAGYPHNFLQIKVDILGPVAPGEAW